MKHQQILILDFGSQYTQLIARRLREQGVFCVVRPCTDAAPSALEETTIGVILSGGPASVLGEDAPAFDEQWFEVDVPILGICYGMQLLSKHFGGVVERGERREYGRAEIERHGSSRVLVDFPERSVVWMSHGDHVVEVPAGYRAVATSGTDIVAAMESNDGRRFGLQFHPEVTHTERGKDCLLYTSPSPRD